MYMSKYRIVKKTTTVTNKSWYVIERKAWYGIGWVTRRDNGYAITYETVEAAQKDVDLLNDTIITEVVKN